MSYFTQLGKQKHHH